MRAETAWAAWLGDFRWTHALTLTFRRQHGPTAARLALGRFFRDLGRRASSTVPWFFVLEQTHSGQLHAHALIQAELMPSEVKAAWQPGQSKVERFDPSRGWCPYITKEVGDGAVDWDISHKARPRRRLRTNSRISAQGFLGIGPSAKFR